MSDTSQVSTPAPALPPTQKQILYARSLALQTNATLPWDIQQDRRALSRWIDAQKKAYAGSEAAQRPTSKQVGFAERLAAMRGIRVPDECFQDRRLMSRWIDSHRN